jgi:hypothetical protein
MKNASEILNAPSVLAHDEAGLLALSTFSKHLHHDVLALTCFDHGAARTITVYADFKIRSTRSITGATGIMTNVKDASKLIFLASVLSINPKFSTKKIRFSYM